MSCGARRRLFTALYKAMAEKGRAWDPSEISGLSYRRSDGEVLENPEGMPLDMREIPFPYRSLPVEADKVVYYETAKRLSLSVQLLSVFFGKDDQAGAS